MANLAVNVAPAAMADSDSERQADCHTDISPTDAASAASGQDCCETDETCDHGDCRCLCPALSLVVPVRATATTWTSSASPTWVLTTAFPDTPTSKLLRPPRA